MNKSSKKKIAYIDIANPDDKRSWSGIPYNIKRQLERHYDVEVVWVPDTPLQKVCCMAYKVINRLVGIKNDPAFTTIYDKSKCRQVDKATKGRRYDAVFFRGSQLAAYSNVETPMKVYFSDACIHQMLGYYLFHWTDRLKKQANEIQQRCMDNCTTNIFASSWALRDAVEFYKIPAEKCHIGYFGASVDATEFHKQAHDAHMVNILFVGVEWVRKGGEIAVNCVKKLNETDKTRRYTLHFVGCRPPYEIKDDHIKFYGFLNRNIPEQAQQLTSLREQADLFLLPTRAECAGIVFCESSAYGIPSITFDTGGIGDYVINGENGYRLPMDSTAEDFAKKILAVLADEGKLQYMQKKAVEMYKERMNWDALGYRLHELIG